MTRRKWVLLFAVVAFMWTGLTASDAAAFDEERPGGTTGSVYVHNKYIWVGDTSRYGQIAVEYHMDVGAGTTVNGRWECNGGNRPVNSWGGPFVGSATPYDVAGGNAHIVLSDTDTYCAYHVWSNPVSGVGFRITESTVQFWLHEFVGGPGVTPPPPGTTVGPGETFSPPPTPTPSPPPTNDCSVPGSVPGYLEMHSSIYDNQHGSATGHTANNAAHTHTQIACTFPLEPLHYYRYTWELVARSMDTSQGGAQIFARRVSDSGTCGLGSITLVNGDLTVGNDGQSPVYQHNTVGGCATGTTYEIVLGTSGHTFNGYGYIFSLGIIETDAAGDPLPEEPDPTPTPTPDPSEDNDGDGYSNEVEAGAGTDPNDPNSYPGSTPNGSPPPGGGYTFPTFPPPSTGPNLGGSGGLDGGGPRSPNKTGIAACDADDGQYTKVGQAPLRPLHDTSFPGSVNPLDYIPWVGNMVSNIPIVVGNAGQSMVNTGVDFVVPGECLPGIVDEHMVTMQEKPPFTLVAEVSTVFEGSPGGALPAIPIPGGGTIPMPTFGDAGATTRSVLAAFVWVLAALSIGRIILGTFGVSSGGSPDAR